ncbi:MAG TPA: glycine oxidase ThiO [Pseudonocardiaceae bacterium]
MRTVSGNSRVVVVGGGVVGLSVAWRLSGAGYDVVVVDQAADTGGSRVAGGMLAPIAEAWPGEEELLELGSVSLAAWPEFAEELTEASGTDPGLRPDGTLVVGTNRADVEQLDALAAYLAERGRQVERLTGRRLRRIEPGLGPEVLGGLSVPGDLAVDNRRLLAALRRAGAHARVRFVTDRVTRLAPGTVHLSDGRTVPCDVVVIAAGAWSGELHPALRGAVRPVKGEILRLRARRTTLPPPLRTVRALVEGRPVYLVPRDAGGLVVGATQYEAGFDADVTVGGVRDLLRDAERVLPGIAEYALVECGVGFRAGSPDNLPLLGWLEPGVLVATGHHRNGLLLAPVTADTVLALVRGTEPPAPARAADPARLRAGGVAASTGVAGEENG